MSIKQGTIEIFVYEENCCDELVTIQDSNGFSLETLIEINKDLQELDFTKYYGKTLMIKPYYNDAQIGNYPPPNIEFEGYWDCDILETIIDFTTT